MAVGRPDIVELGNFVVGERPDPLRYEFLDYLGAPIDISGFTITFETAEADDALAAAPGGTSTDVGSDGSTVSVAVYAWDGTEMTAGSWRGFFTASLGSLVYKSNRIIWYVEAP